MRIAGAVGVVVLVLLIGAAAWLYTPDKPRAVLEARYAAPPSRFIEAAGIRLHVRDTGPRAAPAVILLHGFGSSLQTWDDWAAVLAALMDALGVDRADLIGNSMGGRIAWMFASAHPERVRKLVLVSPDGFASPGVDYRRAEGMPPAMRLLPYVMPTSMLRANVAAAYADPARLTEAVFARYRDMMLAPGVRPAILARMRQHVLADPVPLLGRVQAPTVLLWGERDAMIPQTNAADYLAALPHATLTVLPGLGHVPQEERRRACRWTLCGRSWRRERPGRRHCSRLRRRSPDPEVRRRQHRLGHAGDVDRQPAAEWQHRRALAVARQRRIGLRRRGDPAYAAEQIDHPGRQIGGEVEDRLQSRRGRADADHRAGAVVADRAAARADEHGLVLPAQRQLRRTGEADRVAGAGQADHRRPGAADDGVVAAGCGCIRNCILVVAETHHVVRAEQREGARPAAGVHHRVAAGRAGDRVRPAGADDAGLDRTRRPVLVGKLEAEPVERRVQRLGVRHTPVRRVQRAAARRRDDHRIAGRERHRIGVHRDVQRHVLGDPEVLEERHQRRPVADAGFEGDAGRAERARVVMLIGDLVVDRVGGARRHRARRGVDDRPRAVALHRTERQRPLGSRRLLQRQRVAGQPGSHRTDDRGLAPRERRGDAGQFEHRAEAAPSAFGCRAEKVTIAVGEQTGF